MNVLALCAGAGGLELGLRLAVPDAHAVCYVEGEAYVASLLVAHMEAGRLDTAPVWSDVRTFDGTGWRGKIDCITAGYPCQPFSIAGRKRADQDPRHLWPHVARIAREIQPQWCFFENVANHLSLGFEQVCHDLGNMGYAVAAGLFSAEEVGAPHRRERLFIVAYRARVIGERRIAEGDCSGQPETAAGSGRGELGNAEHAGSPAATERGSDGTSDGQRGAPRRQHTPQQPAGADSLANPTGAEGLVGKSRGVECTPTSGQGSNPTVAVGGGDVADHHGAGCQEQCGGEPVSAQHQAAECGSGIALVPPHPDGDWSRVPAHLKPSVHRMADGLAYRVDRIRACGNGVVPLAAAYAWRTLRACFDQD